MSIFIILLATSFALFCIFLLGYALWPLIGPQRTPKKECQSFINKSNNRVCCSINNSHLVYTYEPYPCHHTTITLERTFVNDLYRTAHQFSGTIDEAIENRLDNINRLNPVEAPVVTRP